jgi:nucleotide-binding universal stress UspA family protein
MILLCYDGSAGAQAAIDLAARAMRGARATVLTIWEPFLEAVNHGSWFAGDFTLGDGGQNYEQIDRAAEQTALKTAAEGAHRAQDGGLVARARVASRQRGIADAILFEAAVVDADVIVVGSRGRGDLKSFLLGSVAHHLVQHADRAVNVVPSRDLVVQRRHVHASSLVVGAARAARSAITR